MQLNMNNRFAVINFSPNLNIRRRTIKLRQLKAMFTFTTLRLHLHTIEYRMPLRGEFRLEIFQFPYWLSNPKFRPPALSFGAQKKFRSESLTVLSSDRVEIIQNWLCCVCCFAVLDRNWIKCHFQSRGTWITFRFIGLTLSGLIHRNGR